MLEMLQMESEPAMVSVCKQWSSWYLQSLCSHLKTGHIKTWFADYVFLLSFFFPMQSRFCTSSKITITQIIQNVQRNWQQFLTILILAVHLLSAVVEELTFAIFQLVLLIAQVLPDLCEIFLSQERATVITLPTECCGWKLTSELDESFSKLTAWTNLV